MSSASPSSAKASTTSIPSSRPHVVETARTIGYSVAGAEDGPLVVLLDRSGSHALGWAMTSISVQLGIKLLVPNAPYLDSSAPPRGRAFAAVADDLMTLVDCARAKRFGIVAAPGGIPYALALAAAAGDRVTGIALVAALTPLPEAGAIRDLAGPMRPVFRVAQQAPWMLHPMFNAYARHVRGDLPATGDKGAPLLRDDLPVAPHDVAESATQGPTSSQIGTSRAALARETRRLAPQSDRLCDGITAPIALWAGEIDALAGAPSSKSDARRRVRGLAVTLHLFSRQTSSTFVTPQGKPLPPNTTPAAGDINENTDIDYVGSHKHHANKPIGSDHLRCTIISSAAAGATGVCDGQIAIGGSMLLVNHETVTLSDTARLTLQINGGTGIYRHAHGKLITTNIGNTSNSDFDIKITY